MTTLDVAARVAARYGITATTCEDALLALMLVTKRWELGVYRDPPDEPAKRGLVEREPGQEG